MLDIISLTVCLGSILKPSQVTQLLDIINAFYLVPYATTTRSLSRYTDCSLRSLFRFLSAQYDWVTISVRFFHFFRCFDPTARYFLAGDETVEGKSRSKTFGISRFYSSTHGGTISGICFFGMSIIRVSSGTSYFLGAGQVSYNSEDKARIAAAKLKQEAGKARAEKGAEKPKGRPLGVKNKPKEENDTASFRAFKTLFSKVIDALLLACKGIKLGHMVLDSAYGTADYANLLKSKGLYLVSKFKSNVHLIFPYDGEQKGKKKKCYGDKVDVRHLPNKFISKVEVVDGYEKTYYIFDVYAKNCFRTQLLNVVVIKSKRLSDGKIGTAILFSNDLSLDCETLALYYHLRFQIEFDFRDAKQHFGLSDFKNYKEQNVTNFVNLSFLLCLVSKIQLAYYRKQLNIEKFSIIDLKLLLKARKNVKNVIKLVRNSPDTIFSDQFADNFIPDDLINAA